MSLFTKIKDTVAGWFGFGTDSITESEPDSKSGPIIMASQTSEDLQSALVAHYKMNDNVASTVVLDSSGNGYHGTSVRDTSLMHVDGKVDGAFDFNGSSDYVDTGNKFEDIFSDSFSTSVWVKPDDGHSFDGEHILIQKFFNGDARYFWLTLESAGEIDVYFEKSISSEEITIITDPVFDSGQETWHHIIIVFEQVSPTSLIGRIYVDGVLEKTEEAGWSLAGYTTNGNLMIGQQQVSPFFAGLIDNVMIFNKALNQEEIDFLYNGGLGREDLDDTTAGQVCYRSRRR